MSSKQEQLNYDAEYKRNWRKNNPEKYHNQRLGRAFGISYADYQAMYAKQEGKCGICGKHQDQLKRLLAVDHNHKTNKIRGLLCGPCNRAIGYLNDNADSCERAAQYLRK